MAKDSQAPLIAMYRPYISGKEIVLLIQLLEKEIQGGNDSPELAAFYKKMRVFGFKIGNGMVNAAIVRKQSTEESLGIVKNPQEKPQSVEQDRFDTLAEKVISGTITEEEKEEGKRLEMMLYKMELGTFA